MTTVVVDRDAELRSEFLRREATRDYPHQVDVAVQRLERVTSAWRQQNWHDVDYHLRADHRLQFLVEPIWVGPGSAIFWKETKFLRKSPLTKDQGWEPVGPLPANTAATIARHLELGLRLRPPHDGVDVEVLDQETAFPSGVSQVVQKQEAPPARYWCKRHGADQYGFRSWESYIDHCSRKRESIEIEVPESERAKAARFRYYCYLHQQGYDDPQRVHEHIKLEARRGGRAPHLDIGDMKEAANLAQKGIGDG